jgi:hypothetical protein
MKEAKDEGCPEVIIIDKIYIKKNCDGLRSKFFVLTP